MKVPNPPGSGKDTAKGKGVPGNGESEGSRRQTSGLTNRNHLQAVGEGKAALQVEAQKLHGIASSRDGRYMEGKKRVVPGEVLRTRGAELRNVVETRLVAGSQTNP